MFYLAPSLKKFQHCLIAAPLLFACGSQVKAQEYKRIPPTTVVDVDAGAGSNTAQDGLSGPVRRVRSEVAGLLVKDGKIVEGSRVLLETTVYNRQGRKVDHSIYAVSSSALVGKESYKYDAQGNIIEMTVRDDAGSIVSQEIYAYEFDSVGNWTKMTTSVAVVENNNITYEPTEITYRTITYYRTDAVAKETLTPAGSADEPSRVSAANAGQKNEAPKTEGGKQVIGLAAGGKVQPAASQMVAPDQLEDLTANNKTTLPSTTLAEKSIETGGETGVEKRANVGGSNKTESSVAEKPAPKPPVKAVSGGVLNGRAINLPRPIYPDLARRSGSEGTVSVEVLIDVTGKVISASAVSGPLQFRAVAVDAARRAKFSPTLLSGQPMRVSGTIIYNFSLK
jgi:TonB family protein